MRVPHTSARFASLSVLLVTGVLAATGTPLTAQTPCTDTPGFEEMDFWVGEWDVFVGEQQVGTNRITKILDGCAVTEEWRSASGGEGRSLFYHVSWSGEWKQVWVTARATATGGVKEKTLVERLDGGGVRFQGRIPDAVGDLWYDRTTLTPLPGGDVRQVIEVSQDGETWETTFDAVYRRRGPDAEEPVEGDGFVSRTFLRRAEEEAWRQLAEDRWTRVRGPGSSSD